MSITIILTGIILICIGVALIQAANALFARERRHYHRHYGRDLLLVDVVVAILYLLTIGFVGALYIFSGYHPAVIYVALAFFVSIALAATLVYCWKHRKSMDTVSAVALLIWFLVVLFLTLFSRLGNEATTRVFSTPFHGLLKAMKQGDMEFLTDFFLNILLFVPIGFLIPRIDPKYLKKISFSLLGGIMLSTMIEGIQFLTGLGMSDVDDVISNSLGALIGYLLWKLVHQIQKNWQL